jgi:putative Mg2+ transporter-C (MgtC) family protein
MTATSWHPESGLTYSEIALRLGLAVASGALLGWERQSHGRAAGLRTTILASVASAIAIIISDMMFLSSSAVTTTAVWRPDPARMAQGILTGIGFLGAGTILRERESIRGVTTAATLWFTTILGIAFGSGYLVIGIAGVAIAMVTLHVLPKFESGIHVDWYSNLTIRCSGSGPTPENLRLEVERLGLKVKTMKIERDLVKKEHTVIFDVKLERAQRFELATKTTDSLATLPGVLAVNWT